jgi:ATP-dependent exoDNAse (exonuclease V) beta subunit
MGRQGVDELLALLPDPTTDDLDAQLATALQQVVQDISGNGDQTGTTAKYVELLRDAHQALGAGRLRWSDWVMLGKERPAKKSQPVAVPVAAVASRVESHSRLRQDISDYAAAIFDIAGRSLAEFQRLKEERGLLDFADLEQRTFHLLRDRPEVRETLVAELNPLVVDESQDTSPIQLALFMQLAACARETVWTSACAATTCSPWWIVSSRAANESFAPPEC